MLHFFIFFNQIENQGVFQVKTLKLAAGSPGSFQLPRLPLLMLLLKVLVAFPCFPALASALKTFKTLTNTTGLQLYSTEAHTAMKSGWP